MKKLFLGAIIAFLSITINAQLVVDSLGRLEITPHQTSSNMFFPTSGYSATIRPISGGLRIEKLETDNHSSNSGIDVYLNGLSSSTTGINSESKSGGVLFNYGIRGIAQSVSHAQTLNMGVYGGLKEPFINGVGVFGSTTTVPSSSIIPSGIYAGYFAGDICVTGSIYGTVLSPTSSNSNSRGEETLPLNCEGESCVTEKLQSVGVLQMHRINNNGSLAANKEQVIHTISEFDKSGLPKEQLQELEKIEEDAKKEPIQTKLSAVSYGLAADQLKEVYPELVYEDAEGNYSINYIEMVPLLVQSIKELSAEVTELKQQLGISEHTKSILKTKGKAEDADNVTLTIPDKMQEATLNVYNLSGNLLCTVPVGATDATSLSSYTRGLPTGTYVYCLTVDGRQQKARKVIVK